MGQLSSYPESTCKSTMNMAPVDYVAAALVHLSRQSSSLGKAFHLVNPDNSFSLGKVVDYFSSWGSPLQPLPYLQWLRRLKADKENVLWPLIASFRDSEDGFPLNEENTYSCKECLKGLEGSDLAKTSQFILSEGVFHRYLAFFGQIGFLPAPGGGAEPKLSSAEMGQDDKETHRHEKEKEKEKGLDD